MEVNTEAEGRLAEARDAVVYANNCGCSECEAHVRDELTAFEEAVRASERASLLRLMDDDATEIDRLRAELRQANEARLAWMALADARGHDLEVGPKEAIRGD